MSQRGPCPAPPVLLVQSDPQVQALMHLRVLPNAKQSPEVHLTRGNVILHHALHTHVRPFGLTTPSPSKQHLSLPVYPRQQAASRLARAAPRAGTDSRTTRRLQHCDTARRSHEPLQPQKDPSHGVIRAFGCQVCVTNWHTCKSTHSSYDCTQQRSSCAHSGHPPPGSRHLRQSSNNSAPTFSILLVL